MSFASLIPCKSRSFLSALALVLAFVTIAQPAMAAKRKHAPVKGRAAKSASAPRGQMELAGRMTRDAYALSRNLPARERAALLTRLLYTMRPEVLASDKQRWAEELFAVAQTLPAGDAVEVDSARNAALATAAARLSLYDADRALELLDTLPSQHGERPDPRIMAARLVFAGYVHHHPSQGAEALMAHARRWGAEGGFPYAALSPALARLRANEDASERFFRQALAAFAGGHEGLYGIADFASLLQQAASLEAISEDSAEEAGREVAAQLQRRAAEADHPLNDAERGLVADALNHLRVSAPKACAAARIEAPSLFAIRPVAASAHSESPTVDAGLQSAFREVAATYSAHRGAEALRAAIDTGMKQVNARYTAGACAQCASPDAQSWAFVSLAAYTSPATISAQLNAIENPFWRAYFLAIAAQQVGQPTRVADPTAHHPIGKEEAEPE